MLKITDPQDLLKYLETRKEFAIRNRSSMPASNAFEESIRAVKAMIECMSQPQLGVYNGDVEE